MKKTKGPYRFPLSRHEAPSYMLYPGVLGHYRAGGTVSQCLWSLFSLHTETVNAWTVIFSLLFSIIGTTIVCFKFVTPIEMPSFLIFTLASVIHTPLSVGFHLLMPINIQTFNLWRRLDVLGIFMGSVCFTISLSYVVFPWWGVLINSSVALTIAIFASLHFWQLQMTTLDNKRHAMFIGSIIICYWFPMLYTLGRDIVSWSFTLSSVMVIGEITSLILGGLAFSTSWPQSIAPGRFDVFGHSHQMLHVAAMVAHTCKFVFLCTKTFLRDTLSFNSKF